MNTPTKQIFELYKANNIEKLRRQDLIRFRDLSKLIEQGNTLSVEENKFYEMVYKFNEIKMTDKLKLKKITENGYHFFLKITNDNGVDKYVQIHDQKQTPSPKKMGPLEQVQEEPIPILPFDWMDNDSEQTSTTFKLDQIESKKLNTENDQLFYCLYENNSPFQFTHQFSDFNFNQSTLPVLQPIIQPNNNNNCIGFLNESTNTMNTTTAAINETITNEFLNGSTTTTTTTTTINETIADEFLNGSTNTTITTASTVSNSNNIDLKLIPTNTKRVRQPKKQFTELVNYLKIEEKGENDKIVNIVYQYFDLELNKWVNFNNADTSLIKKEIKKKHITVIGLTNNKILNTINGELQFLNNQKQHCKFRLIDLITLKKEEHETSSIEIFKFKKQIENQFEKTNRIFGKSIAEIKQTKRNFVTLQQHEMFGIENIGKYLCKFKTTKSDVKHISQNNGYYNCIINKGYKPTQNDLDINAKHVVIYEDHVRQTIYLKNMIISSKHVVVPIDMVSYGDCIYLVECAQRTVYEGIIIKHFSDAGYLLVFNIDQMLFDVIPVHCLYYLVYVNLKR